MSIGTLLAFIFGLFLLYIIGLLLVIPIKIIGKLIVNGILGGILLLIFNLIGGIFGLNLIINPVTAIVVGFLGIPGVILLLILQWVL
ncbi:pro-sigmaK processing inhibitor BofA family protein [Clostridium cochlearium]|uniref:pro-sigmaK processing inhibitor BofA family protein n=1 Tax=Clostridium cochlearium TaxID=1494 RepID=UPI0017DA4A43|nr:pro-sigmaK processing inhibitor BofA family protein [Clostridium cochlearium]NMA58854.1 pro-sigmaK processing inhibitor BofA [Clostridium cochlearium]